MAEYNGIMVVAETKAGKVAAGTYELLAMGRRLADQAGQGLSAALVGSQVASLAQELVDCGADKVYVVDDPSLAEFQVEAYTHAGAAAVAEARPAVLLLSHSLAGRDLAPRLAMRLGSGVVMNCGDLQLDRASSSLKATCPVFGGDARAVYEFDEARPQVVTVQEGLMDPAAAQARRRGEVVTVDARMGQAAVHARVVDRMAVTGPRIEDADILVSGGLGLQEKENYRFVQELADVLGGQWACSRPLADREWVDPTHWVGLTGRTVKPNLYLAVGISGASQHMAGLSSCRNIVAVNTDEAAPIFRHARYGVVADGVEFLQVMIEKARQLRAGAGR